VIVTFNSTGTSTRRPRTCETASPHPQGPAGGCDAALISKFDNDQQPVLTVALAGDLPLRELTELADKVVKIRLERSAEWARCGSSGVGALGQRVGGGGPAGRLRDPITDVRDAIVRQNADAAGAT